MSKPLRFNIISQLAFASNEKYPDTYVSSKDIFSPTQELIDSFLCNCVVFSNLSLTVIPFGRFWQLKKIQDASCGITFGEIESNI